MRPYSRFSKCISLLCAAALSIGLLALPASAEGATAAVGSPVTVTNSGQEELVGLALPEDFGQRGNLLTINRALFTDDSGISTVDAEEAAEYTNVTGTSVSRHITEVYDYLLEQGFSAEAACGVLGNLQEDSSFDASTVNEDGTEGLFRLGGAWAQLLQSSCEERGLDYDTRLGQTEALLADVAPTLFTLYTGTGTVYEVSSDTQVSGEHLYEAGYCWWPEAMTLEDFKQLDDPRLAAEIWRRIIPRTAGTEEEITSRCDYADAFYTALTYVESGEDIIVEALKYVGNPYVWGGNDLYNGIDCSHFVCAVLYLTGHYTGGYLSSAYLRYAGEYIPTLAEARPGDVLCYNGHVAFYINSNTIVHAANSRRGICVYTGINIARFDGGLISIRRFE